MARSNQGLKITDFLSRMFGRTGRPSRQPSRRRRELKRNTAVENLESRALLTLVGVDFGGGTTPTNWTGYAGTTDTSFTDLIDETGTATAIDLDVNMDATLQTGAGNTNFVPPAANLPTHSQSLAGIDGAFTDQGNIELTFSGLIPDQYYDIYVFAGDTFQDNQRVTISEPATGSQLAQFTQLHNANQLIVNRAPGSSGQTLNSYAELVKADSTGRLLVRVDSSGGFFFGLAGIAIEESQPPTPDVLIGNATVDESAGTASFPVTLTSAANDDITLTLATASGTALPGQDFTPTTAQVTILTGQTTATATFDVPIIDDVDAELDEMFTVSVQSVDAGTVANTADTGTGTIPSSDLALAVVINDATV